MAKPQQVVCHLLMSRVNHCLIRKRLVANTPEERVRQSLIQKMIADLGFPKGLISIEKGIGKRRYDIVCYTQLCVPLLLVECKAIKLNDAAVRQAFGYNATVKAPFICIATPTEIKTFWQEEGRIASVPFLPMFSELYEISLRKITDIWGCRDG